jgi:hypothetical protein
MYCKAAPMITPCGCQESGNVLEEVTRDGDSHLVGVNDVTINQAHHHFKEFVKGYGVLLAKEIWLTQEDKDSFNAGCSNMADAV